MKFNCVSCGEIDHVIVDGYAMADRLLEGVNFEVRRDDEGKYQAQVEESARSYFSNLNQTMYLAQACEDAEKGYSFCSKCGEEMGNPSTPAIEMTLENFGNLLGGLGTFSVGKAIREESSSCDKGASGGGGASDDLDDKDEFVTVCADCNMENCECQEFCDGCDEDINDCNGNCGLDDDDDGY